MEPRQTRNALFESYYSTLWQDIHSSKNFEATALGYEESYGQVLPDNKDAALLDFGCGMGHCLYFLKQKGYKNIKGLEVSPQMAKMAMEKAGVAVDVVTDSIDYLNTHKETFDCIFMNDVIEHFKKEDIIPHLKAMYAALKKGGTLYVHTPGISGFTSMISRYNDFTHEIIFMESTLKQVLRLGGFENIQFIKIHEKFKLHPRTLVFRFLKQLWVYVLKFIYLVERPGDPDNPQFFLQPLVAVARK